MIRVAAFYHFATIAAPATVREQLASTCAAAQIKGTILVAGEGLNGTIAGTSQGVETVLAAMRALPGFATLAHKVSAAETMPFHRMKVRVKREIVTMGEPDIDPLAAGHRVAAAEWNRLIAEPGTLLIDTRNDYEVAVGSFSGAIDPETGNFREFPDWVRANRERLAAAPRVAMFCTGGIRCEKATAFVRAQGVPEVYHLDGGILKYLEDIPRAESLWDGECFVFDQRVAVGHGLAPGTHALCHACRMPVSAAERASPLYVEGVSCRRCHTARSDDQRAGYAERHRQEALAKDRGGSHVGATPPDRRLAR